MKMSSKLVDVPDFCVYEKLHEKYVKHHIDSNPDIFSKEYEGEKIFNVVSIFTMNEGLDNLDVLSSKLRELCEKK